MNKIIFITLAVIVAVSAAPSQISSNNAGDIVNVGIKADLDKLLVSGGGNDDNAPAGIDFGKAFSKLF
ncbi:hypothetical protein PVAND_013064 [Polypedilum vanderplanki]|uniref:Uncharacterized protein n=1 Tax=Polypedilum vanderplanki TaxID=319348 RepID=A0A9J6CPB3_POLVA|nr:hypothetical protein PVAND_013064 [Polypedilum vanderplanki]